MAPAKHSFQHKSGPYETLNVNPGEVAIDIASLDSERTRRKRDVRNLYNELQFQVWLLMEPKENSFLSAKIFDFLLFSLILLNSVVVIMVTDDRLREHHKYFETISLACIIIFTIEYACRLWCVGANPKKKYEGFLGRLKWIIRPMSIIDLSAVAPFWAYRTGGRSRSFQLLSLLRLLSLLKLERQVSAFEIFSRVIRKKFAELVMAVFVISVALVVCSAGLYAAENAVNTPGFESMLTSMWWGAITLTTVGYGDVVPRTALGRTLGGITSFIGVSLFALPTGILAAGFMEEIQLRDKVYKVACPNCSVSFQCEETDMDVTILPRKRSWIHVISQTQNDDTP